MSIRQIKEYVKEASDKCNALNRSLASLDASINSDLRRELAISGEHLLQNVVVREYVKYVMCSCPFPRQADLEGALHISEQADLHYLLALLNEVADLQDGIKVVHKAWNTIPLSEFTVVVEKDRFQSTAVQEGLFYVLSIEVNHPERRGQGLVRGLRNSKISSIPNYAAIMKWWLLAIEEITNGTLPATFRPIYSVHKGLNAGRQTTVSIGGVEFNDLSRLAYPAIAQMNTDLSVFDTFASNRFLVDPSFIANKLVIAKEVKRKGAFS